MIIKILFFCFATPLFLLAARGFFEVSKNRSSLLEVILMAAVIYMIAHFNQFSFVLKEFWLK